MLQLGSFAYGEVALAAIVIPLAGILFLKRQRLLCQRFGYMTPGAMFADYYQGELIRLLTVLIALVFAIPFVGLGCLAYAQLGGFGACNAALARLGAPGSAAANLFEIPGVVQFTEGLGKQAPAGGLWTTSMILTCSFALMGLQASPSFSMLGFSCRDTRGIAAQQVWATGAIVGLVLLFFATAYGLGGLAPGNAVPVDPTTAAIQSVAPRQPWLSALLAICIIAAVQMAAAAYVSTTATMVTLDVYKRFFRPAADDRAQRRIARAAMALIFIVALLMATSTLMAQIRLGGLALAFALQLWPVLAGVRWLPWVSRPAATAGLCVGLVAVLLTEPVGAAVAQFLGFDLPWRRWPWTIHSAGWGIFFNVLTCAVVSLATCGGAVRHHRDGFHRYLHARAGLPASKQVMQPAVWALILGWMFFAIGPGAVLGNDLFGAPGAGIAAWKLGIPSLWAWQIIWWALGVFVIWWLAYKMEFATAPRNAA